MRENRAHNSESLLVGADEAARLLDVSRSKFYSMVADGLLKPVKIPPKTTRFRRAEIEKLASGEAA